MVQKRSSLYYVLWTIVASLLVSNSWAQTVYWTPSNGTMQQGKGNTIDLIFDSCDPENQPEVPDLPRIELSFRGKSSSKTIINGRLSSKIILNYQLVPIQLGQISIPSFEVETSEGTLTVPEARFEVVEATVGNTGLSPSEVFLSLFQTRDASIYQGEVFELEYIAGAKQNYQLADLSVPQWSPSKIVTSGLVDDRIAGVNYEGDQYTVKVYKARAIATESGVIELPGATQQATVVVGRRRDFMFQEPVYDSFAIESEPFAIEVKPLPEGAPDSFNGAVGQFSLNSRVVPQEVQVGEPVTWTLELSGEGNWPAGIGVPARSVSSRFKAIQPEIKESFDEADLFSGSQTEDIVLIPTEEGEFKFGPLKYTYFDTEEETYKTIEVPETVVTVTPASPNNPALTGAPTPSDDFVSNEAIQSGGQNNDLDPTGFSVASKEPEMLKEPISSITVRPTPQEKTSLLVPTALSVGAPLLCWFLFAFVSSVSKDPNKENRKALSDLRKLANAPLPSGPKEIRDLHLKWRQAASRYFETGSIELTPPEIEVAARALKDAEFAASWKKAWELSDQILFGREENANPSQWQTEAQKAAAASPRKGFQVSRLFRYKAWLPLLLFTLAATEVQPNLSAQESADSLYQQGKFKQASAAWENLVEENPNVFEYRYNAGIAAAQNGNWSRAWALWTSAFCLDPQNEAVAWNLRIAHQHTTAYDPVLQGLLEGEGLYATVRLRSPAAWQTLSRQAIIAGGALLCIAVIALYLRPLKRLAVPLFGLGVLAILLSHFSMWSFSKYEALGSQQTLLVTKESPLLSVPTDLQTEQIQTTIGEGSIARPEKTFLGWIKVALPNGESGWLRKESILPLYGKPSHIPIGQ